MKKLLLLIGAVCLLSGCSTYDTSARVSLLHDVRDDIEGGNPVFLLEIEKKFTDEWSCSYFHLSHIWAGRPFNSRQEDTLDALGCSVMLWGK